MLPRPVTAFAALALMSVLAAPAMAGGDNEGEVAFTEAYLNNPENVVRGKEIWDEQCKLCHGKSAYPGKGPKLKPRKYTPEFVYKRVTRGYRGMPAWDEVYNREERMAVTAWVKSKDFSN